MENPITMGIDDVSWLIEKRAQVLEEIALDPEGSAHSVPEMRELNERVRQAEAVQDMEAKKEADLDRLRVWMRESWQDFEEMHLLTDLFRRASNRKRRTGTKNSRRPPDHSECVRVADALLAEVKGKSRLDPADVSKAATEVLLGDWLSETDMGKSRLLEDYIQRSADHRPYFDALRVIFLFLSDLNADIPRPLEAWTDEYSDGRRNRPPLAPLDPHRPINPANLVRDIQIQFVILVLQRLGVAPWGTHVSGCRIVAEALEISEDTVGRIWRERIWKGPFAPVLWKYVNPVSELTGFCPTLRSKCQPDHT